MQRQRVGPTRRVRPRLRRVLVVGLGVAAAISLTACQPDRGSGTAASSSPTSTAPSARRTPTPCGTYSGRGCAPARERVDLVRPTFSNPTKVTNPLFPISQLRSAVLLGHVDGKPFRSETTLLPNTERIAWDGREVETLVSQYVAYLDGRLEEVARDRYAQADDGSVWYFGEDVMDYRNGAVALTEGTWLAGREGSAAMIMPAHPKVGDVFRLEDVTGVVFEEVKVKSVGQTVQAARGPVGDAILAEELHADQTYDHKIYAPGHGEFPTTSGGDLEALALAVPTDVLPGPPPAELRSLSTYAVGILELARLPEWEAASATLKRMGPAWDTLRTATRPPPMIDARLGDALHALTNAVKARQAAAASQAAVDVAQSVLDQELAYRPPAELDARRFGLWSQQLRVDAAAKDLAGVTGDVAVLEWIRDRFAPALDPVHQADLDTRLRDLRTAADAKNLATAAGHAARLEARLRDLGAI